MFLDIEVRRYAELLALIPLSFNQIRKLIIKRIEVLERPQDIY